jgi:hypothetical protein
VHVDSPGQLSWRQGNDLHWLYCTSGFLPRNKPAIHHLVPLPKFLWSSSDYSSLSSSGSSTVPYLVLPLFLIWFFHCSLSGSSIVPYLVLPLFLIWFFHCSFSGSSTVPYLVFPVPLTNLATVSSMCRFLFFNLKSSVVNAVEIVWYIHYP